MTLPEAAPGRTAPAPAVEETARAKVNLDLLVTGRRADGYHELDSLVVFVDLADRLTLRLDEGLRLEASGRFAAALVDDADNLVLRAAHRLAAHAGVPARAAISLEKRIPVAAGLGGGSADAAATLRGLCRLWRLALPPGDLAALALGLGADVPVCLESRAARMRGIGERLDPVPDLPRLHLLLVNPGVPVATAAVFAGLEGRVPPPGPDGATPSRLPDLVAWLETRANHLEAPALRLAPVIGEVLEALRARPGCRLARLSGSGATCFGLFDDRAALAGAEAALGAARPDWWVQASTAG